MPRPKKTAKDLPPRLLRKTRQLASGKLWVGYYYQGRDDSGRRVQIPLGPDLAEAKRKWAALEAKPTPADVGTMGAVFERFVRDILPTKAPRTQKDYLAYLRMLRPGFDPARVASLTPPGDHRLSRPARAHGPGAGESGDHPARLRLSVCPRVGLYLPPQPVPGPAQTARKYLLKHKQAIV